MPSWKKLISSGSAASLSSLSLDTALPVSEGGTGTTSLTSNGILTGNGTSAIQAESNLTFDAATGNFSSGDGSESVTHEPSSNYLTVHETGASKGSHLRLATDNSDFILTAGGSTNQLSLYDVNGAANRLVVNSSGTFQFQQDVDVSGALTLGTALAVAEGGTGATTLTSNRVLTGNGTSAIQAEGNLSFSGTELGVTGGVDITGTYQTNNVVAINSDGNFEVHDNRATSGSTDLGVKGVRFDFKSNSADGLSDGGTYHGLMTIQQWNDSSGGHTHNLGFTDNGYIYHRNAQIAGSWGNWKKLIQEDESGNVGIGESAPASKLQVQYTTTSNGSAAIAEFGESGTGAIANSGHQVIIGGPSVGGYTGAMIYSDSTSGVGQISFADGRGANDSWRGTIAYEHANDRMQFWTNAAEKIRIESDGDLHGIADIIAYSSTPSDERLKDNVVTIGNSLDLVSQLRGVRFDWNIGSKKGKHDIGVIAQEVEQVIPEIVSEKKLPLLTGNDETIYKVVDYEKLTAVLIESIKELKQEVDEIKQKCDCLNK